MKPSSQRVYAIGAAALAIVLFVAVNMIANIWLSSARLDLTENRLYTVSPGTKAILSKLQQPVKLTFYYSRELATDYSAVVTYSARVRDLLREYAALSNGKLQVAEVDPAPFTPAEDDAVKDGLTGAPTDAGDNIYFGLYGTNSTNGHEVIPFFDQAREQYLEYDITSLIYKLSQTQKPKLGILSTLPLDGGAGNPEAQLQGGGGQPFTIYEQLRDTYDVQMLDTNLDRIPADISTLMVVHPAAFSDAALYAIDQFVMRGGHAIVMVDPNSEMLGQSAPGVIPGQNDKANSTLQPMLKTWGVDYDSAKVVADADLAQPVQVGADTGDGNPHVVDYIAWLKLTPANFNAADPVTGSLQQVNLASAGALAPIKGATTTFTPLITSSTDAALLPSLQVRITQNPDDLLRNFHPTGMKYTLAARITGPAKTAYPSGAPAPQKPADDAAAPAPPPPATPLPAQIKDSKDINVIVIADSDFLDDRFWVQVQNVLGQRVAIPSADNGPLVINAVENMMGSDDLISLRTRERSNRPFIVVQDIRRDAERRYLAQEQALQQRVTQTEESLRTLQGQGQQQNGAPANQVLSKEQQAQIDKLRTDLVTTRASLRQVQASLRSDVENLGDVLAALNIALVPIFVAAAAIGLALLRGRRRARGRGL